MNSKEANAGRRVRIVESRAHVLALSEGQALALSALGRQLVAEASRKLEFDGETERSVIRCTLISHERWSVFVDNAVGIVAVPGMQITIEPKIPITHLIYLLERAQLIPRLERHAVNVLDSISLVELIAKWFLSALEQLFRDDLLHDYREEHESLGVVRGSLDISSTVNCFYAGVPRFACTFDEFDVDTALNRLLKAGAEHVAMSGAFSMEVRRRFRLVARRFLGVGALKHDDLLAKPDRRTAGYGDAVMLAKLLLRGQSRSIESGARRAWAFLLPTPWAVQEALTRILADYLRDWTSVAPRSIPIGSGLSANPDLVFPRFGAVADVKYKLQLARWNRSDLYQVVAFARAFRSNLASIVAFADSAEGVPTVARFGETNVTSLIWPAEAELEAEVACSRLCEAVRSWLESAISRDGSREPKSLGRQ